MIGLLKKTIVKLANHFDENLKQTSGNSLSSLWVQNKDHRRY